MSASCGSCRASRPMKLPGQSSRHVAHPIRRDRLGSGEPSGARRMRLLSLALILLAVADVAHAEAVFKVGAVTRDFVPAGPYDSRGARTHVLRAMIWYPVAADAREEPQWIGP